MFGVFLLWTSCQAGSRNQATDFPGIPDHCDLNKTGFICVLEHETNFEARVPPPDKENIYSVALYFYLVVLNIIKHVGLLKITVVAVFLNEQFSSLWFATEVFISARKHLQMRWQSPVVHLVNSRTPEKLCNCHSWKCSRNVWLWHLETLFSGGCGSAGLDSIILEVSSTILWFKCRSPWGTAKFGIF